MDRLRTGVSVLDRVLDGGLPAGSLVVLKADAASQSELFLNTFCGVRDTRYLTTVRSAAAVERGIERSTLASVDEVTIRSAHGEGAIEQATAGLEGIPDGSTLIVDSVEPLERVDPETYRRFLDDLSERVVDAEAMAVLHAMKDADGLGNRVISEQLADVVFDLRTRVTGADVEHRLVVPKLRGGVPPDEPLKLKLGDSVRVDTSRDIA